jgi:hypoxanthine phosphoribosyltransferase
MTQLFATHAAIQNEIARIGTELKRDYEGQQPLLVGVLKGSLPFLADLVRACPIDIEVDLLALGQFGDEAKQGGVVRILKDLDTDIQGRQVLLIEDIVDQGLTLQYLTRLLSARGPASLRVVTLLDRTAARVGAIKPDYSGFEVGDGYLVGYGLDAAERFRNLRNLWLLEQHPESLDEQAIEELHVKDARTSS